METQNNQFKKGSFGYDLEFLKKHKELIVLKQNKGLSQLILIKDYQGRVMTSTANGLEGDSYGWINYGLISSGKFVKHINVFGGEDRLWIGPEGGQFSIFFEKGKEMIFDNWQTPVCIDTEDFDLKQLSETEAGFFKTLHFKNYSGTEFQIDIQRKVSIFSLNEIEKLLGIKLNEKVKCVGFQSDNIMINSGKENWKKVKGLIAIWMLGMFNPSEKMTIVIPLKNFDNHSVVNSDYFGEVPSDRLKIEESKVFFKGDGKFRSKLGVQPENVDGYLGSYDPDKKVLTIVNFNYEGDKDYTNSLWEIQEKPFAGDVINTYNDGPLNSSGDQLGPFYELETTSAARELKKGESLTHIHKTFHFQGNVLELDKISRKFLKAGIEEIEKKF